MKIYEQKNGYNVIVSGSVIIDNVKHRVKAGFVSCNAGLNHKAWDITKEKDVCLKCFKIDNVQLKFDF